MISYYMKEQLSPRSFLKKRIYESTANLKRGKLKLSEEDFVVPKFSEYGLLSRYNYNVSQLKTINKQYKLKISGTKRELIYRVYNYLKYSYYAGQIQKVFRGYMLRKLNKARGPALFNRTMCVNKTDFLSMEDIREIPCCQFLSFTTKDGFTYGYELCSIYMLLKKHRERHPSSNLPKNPYNRQSLPANIRVQIDTIIRLSRIYNLELKLDLEDPQEHQMTLAERNASKTISVFQLIEELGNYVDHEWFAVLDRDQLLIFHRELLDIWEYRAQLSEEIKQKICPPTGNPFTCANLHNLRFQSVDNIRSAALIAMHNLVSKGVDDGFKALGAYYVLTALTIVSFEAAQNLPWLYEAMQ